MMKKANILRIEKIRSFSVQKKDALTVSTVLKTAGFDEIMRYLIEEKHALYIPDHTYFWKKEECASFCKKEICRYYFAYNQMISCDAEPDDSCEVNMKYIEDEVWGDRYDVYMIKTQEKDAVRVKKYALDDIRWDTVMGYTVSQKLTEEIPLACIAAEIIFELTYSTYEMLDFDIRNCRKDSAKYRSLLKKKADNTECLSAFSGCLLAEELVGTFADSIYKEFKEKSR